MALKISSIVHISNVKMYSLVWLKYKLQLCALRSFLLQGQWRDPPWPNWCEQEDDSFYPERLMALTLVTLSSPMSLQPGLFRRIKLKDDKWGRKQNILAAFCLWPEPVYQSFPYLGKPCCLLASSGFLCRCYTQGFFCPCLYLNFLWSDLNFGHQNLLWLWVPTCGKSLSFDFFFKPVTLSIFVVFSALCCKWTWAGPCKMACAAETMTLLTSGWSYKPHNWADSCSWPQCHTVLIASKWDPL